LTNKLQEEQGIICTAIQVVLRGFEVAIDQAKGANDYAQSRRSFISRDELKYFPRQSAVSSSIASMSMRAKASFDVFGSSKKSFMGAAASMSQS